MRSWIMNESMNNEWTQPRIQLENTYVPETVSVGLYVLSISQRVVYTCLQASLCLVTMQLICLWGHVLSSDVPCYWWGSVSFMHSEMSGRWLCVPFPQDINSTGCFRGWITEQASSKRWMNWMFYTKLPQTSSTGSTRGGKDGLASTASSQGTSSKHHLGKWSSFKLPLKTQIEKYF